MGMPFITRAPNRAEEQLLALMLSSFSDGSGNETEKDGTSRAGWREIERLFAEYFTGEKHSEDKDVFDVIAPDWDKPSIAYGISIKSKQLTGSKSIFHEHGDARAYLEIANSPAKMWASITKQTGLLPQDFTNKQSPQAIGDALLNTIKAWKDEGKQRFEKKNLGKTLDLGRSYYLTLSLSPYDGSSRDIHVCSFKMAFPKVSWTYRSGKCLRASDPDHPNEPLLDWYANSGGQLKYYPRFDSADFSSSVIKLKKVVALSIAKRAHSYFSDDFEKLRKQLDAKQIALIDKLLR